MEDNQSLLQENLHIDSIGQSYLSETAKWGNFLAIVGFVFSGLIAIVAFFIGTIFATLMSNFNPYAAAGASMGVGFITGLYLLIAVFYFFMSLLLYRFSRKMKTALETNDQESLNESFLNLKKIYKITGIITIVYLSLIALGILVVFISALATRH
jgi:hypothetical protein